MLSALGPHRSQTGFGLCNRCQLRNLFTAEGKLESGAKKQYVDGHLFFPLANPSLSDNQVSGPLRIIVRNDFAYFQVGPTGEGNYLKA
jgi:hypothetical protein